MQITHLHPCLTCRSARTLAYYLSETNLNLYHWLLAFIRQNPIPKVRSCTACDPLFDARPASSSEAARQLAALAAVNAHPGGQVQNGVTDTRFPRCFRTLGLPSLVSLPAAGPCLLLCLEPATLSCPYRTPSVERSVGEQ